MRWLERVERWLESHSSVVYSFLLVLLGVCTFGFQFSQPPETQWDETYYIPTVARYEQGVFFMESHPPLGKLLLTLGDVVFQSNKDIDQSTLIRYDAINGGGETVGTLDDLPDGYSFFGIRFFPVVSAILIPLVVMGIVCVLTQKEWLGFIAGLFIILDNALVLHFRSAMLDSILILLILSALYYMTKAFQESITRGEATTRSIVFSVFFTGLALATKLNALFLLIPLVVVLYLNTPAVNLKSTKLIHKIDVFFYRFSGAWLRFVLSLVAIFTIVTSVIGVHFLVANQYNNTLVNNEGLYSLKNTASSLLTATADNLVKNGKLVTFTDYMGAIAGYYKFSLGYHTGVPGYSRCEKDSADKGEVCNGSQPWHWPFGAHSINFRWGQLARETTTRQIITKEQYDVLPEEGKLRYEVIVSYFTLVANPVVWGVSLFTLVATIITLAYNIYQRWAKKTLLTRSFWQLLWIFLCYAAYMFIASAPALIWQLYPKALESEPRILYLYHYFTALILSCAMFAVWLHHVKLDSKQWFQYALVVILCSVVAGFLWFSPFTYGIPLSSQEFDWRNWFWWWGIKKV